MSEPDFPGSQPFPGSRPVSGGQKQGEQDVQGERTGQGGPGGENAREKMQEVASPLVSVPAEVPDPVAMPDASPHGAPIHSEPIEQAAAPDVSQHVALDRSAPLDRAAAPDASAHVELAHSGLLDQANAPDVSPHDAPAHGGVPEQEKPIDASSALLDRARRERLLRRAIIAGLVFIGLPYLLMPLYLVVDPVSTPMLFRMLSGQRVERTIVPLKDVANVLPRIVIAAEDARYCEHGGVDWSGLFTLVAEADTFSDLRGGSSLTQQTVKNLFLWPGRSYLRKALELPLSIWADLILPKRRIMEIYLNIAEWGPDGEFGVEAAAQRAFGKSARNLTTREAALLVAMLPNPIQRDAANPGATLRRLSGLYSLRASHAPDLDKCVRETTAVSSSGRAARSE